MEKKIRIDIEIDDALKSLEKVNSTMEETEATAKDVGNAISGQGKAIEDHNAKIQKLLREEMQDLEELKRRRSSAWSKTEIMEYDKRIQETGARIKAMGGSFTELKSVALMSLGEMKKELRSMRNMSFDGLSEQEIQGIRQRMSQLTDAIGDFQGQIRSSAQDAIPALVTGFQSMIAAVQIVSGALELFGIENEKLEKNMITLIAVSQAFAQIQQAVELGHYKTAKAVIVETAAKIKARIATTTLGKAMMALPIGWIIAGLAAITAGVYLLIKAFERKKSTVEELSEKYSEMFDEGMKVVAQMEIQAIAVNKAERGTQAYADAVKSYNEMAKKQKLLLIDVNDSLSEQNRIMKENKKLILARIAMQAAEEELVELMKERFKLQMAYENAEGRHWDWKTNTWVDEKAILAGQINNLNSQIKSLLTLNDVLEPWVKNMDAIAEAQAKQSDRLKDFGKFTTAATKATGKNTEAEKKSNKTKDETVKVVKTLNELTLDAIQNGSGWSDEMKRQKEMMDALNASAKTYSELMIDFAKKTNDATAKIKAQTAAFEQLKKSDKTQERIELIDQYEKTIVGVGNMTMSVFDAIASSAEDGSEREKKARKSAALAALAISTAEATAAIAKAIMNAQSLLPPFNILEAIRIGALGVTQLAVIVKAKNDIAKMKYGGRGEFAGPSHEQGGIRFGNVEVEGGEKFYVLSKQHSKKYGHIMDQVFDDIKTGKIAGQSNVFAPNINLNDEYTKGIFNLMKTQSTDQGRFIEKKQGNRITRVYKN